MNDSLMNLKILLPHRVYAETTGVNRIVFETSEGYYGLMPQRLDCVAALVPGIFTYEIEKGKVFYLAIDEGVLIKAGTEVSVSVRNAIGGVDLGNLKDVVKKEFINLDENEKNARSRMAKIESQLIQNLEEFRRQ